MQGFDEIPPVVLERMHNGEIQRWLPADIFIDGPEPFFELAQLEP